MNALNIKLTVIGAVVLLIGSPLLHAVSFDEVPVSVEVEQTDVEPQEAAEKKIEVNEPEAKPELTSEGWKFAIVTVKANWLDNPDIATVRKEVQSGCTALQYRELEELDSDPLNFGPSLAFGRPGYVAGFESASELGDQIAWLKSHGLLIDLMSSEEITDGVFVNIPLIKELMSARELTNPLWEVRLFQDRVTADYVDLPFKRLRISRVLKNDLPDSETNRKGFVDITKFEFGSEIAGTPPEAFTLHFFPLNRDEVIREQLSSVSDAVAFFIVYPGNAEFNQVLKDAAAGNTKVFQYRYKFGNHTMGVHERSIPIHGWEAKTDDREGMFEPTTDRFDDAGDEKELDSTSIRNREVASETIHIKWSEGKDELYGCSTKLGTWETLPLDTPQKTIRPWVGKTMAGVAVRDHQDHYLIAAFSAETGGWDVVDLGYLTNASTALNWMTRDVPTASINTKEHRYTYSANTGSWTSPTDPELQPANETIELRFESSRDMSPFNNVHTLIKRFEKQFEIWRESLPRYKARGIAFTFDSLTGKGTATFQTARKSWLKEMKARIHEAFDVSEGASTAESTVDATSQSAVVKELEEQIATLQAKLNALRSSTPKVSEAATKQPDKATLRKQVEQAFDVRQQLQELEAQKLRLKLQLIEANLESRQKNRDGIIERRVEELLDPNGEATEWNSSGDSKDAATGVAVTDAPSGLQRPTDLPFGMPATQSPVGLSGPPHSPDGSAEAARPFQKDSTQTVATLPANVQHAAAAMTRKQPSEIISQLRKAQTAVESRRRHQSQMKEWAREYSEKKKSLTPGSDEYARIEGEIKELEDENALFTDAHMEDLLRDWTQPWSEYQTQVRLLRLDVESAKASLAPLIQVRDLRKRLVEKGVFSEIDFAQTESEVKLAEIQLRRAEELLQLYTDIEKNEPQLNPDYKAPPVEAATDAEAVPDTKPEQ